jgi:hypothetical protein
MLHLVKLCVGATSIEDLAEWQASYPGFKAKPGGKRRIFHTTFQSPKKQAELLDGGSLYWVIKGFIQARQQLIGFDDGHKEDGSPCCLLLLDPKIVPVRPQPRKAFQGWRYLAADDAPPDLGKGAGASLATLPPELRKELAALGLI